MSAVKTIGQVINELIPGKFANLGKVLPSGSLEVRKLKSRAVLFYWRSTIGGKTERVTIGHYDSDASPKALKPTIKGYSVAAAMRAAETLAQKHQDNKPAGGYPALVAAQKESKQKAAAAKHEAAKQTLQNLLNDYCHHLEALGRVAFKDARSIFKLHVIAAWPKIAALPANEVSGEQIADMMRRVLELGKGRTANKLRSYVRAAYQTARAARSKASIPVHFKAYNVGANPAADTEPDESQNKADKNPLTADQLRTYWQAIKALPGFRGAVLRLHLLTGGQRIEQLVNLLSSNVTGDSILLYDGKGRPGKPPRPHTVPLIPAAASALLDCKPQGHYALSTDGGKTHLGAITLSAWAVEAAVEIPDFQAKRIRSGVETLLASVGVSTEIRGRLQSHGIAGVQARHYDGHDYLSEKRKALETLHKLLNQKPASNVTPIKKRA
ncbi:integrase [Polaromonas sp.]|uniref:integrase n=1 Tax=Polaromonas sp. TaxID=1869339 RepID=UPI002730F1DF|nr:integrase [Polaromonas sp.]MDP1887543.1 integrase [Polaromonas sp.]